MLMVLSVSLHSSRFTYSSSNFKRWCGGNRSRTSSALIICQPAVHPMTSPYLPLVAPSAMSAGDLVVVPSSWPRSMVVPRETPALEESTPEAWEKAVQEMSGSDGTSLGAVSVEVDGASPRPGDDTRGSLRDLVMPGIGIAVPGSTAPGDTTPSPGSSGTSHGPGVSGLLMSGSPNFLTLSIDWRWLEDNAEFAYS
jgi:hypothetical protein